MVFALPETLVNTLAQNQAKEIGFERLQRPFKVMLVICVRKIVPKIDPKHVKKVQKPSLKEKTS